MPAKSSRRFRLGISLATCALIQFSGFSGAAWAQESESKSTRPPVTPVTIASELRSLSPGAPLSDRALVQRPQAVKGAVSWSIETRRHRGIIYGVAISPDSKWLASGGIDGIVRIWNMETGEFTRALVGHDSYVFSLAFSPDGRTLASAGSWDYTARLWDTRTGMMLKTFKHEGYVSKVNWSADGRILFVGGTDSGAAVLWDVTRGAEVSKKNFGQPILASTFSPSGQTFAVSSRQGLPQLLDASTYQLKRTLGDDVGDVTSLAWHPDGKLLAATNAKGTRIWDDSASKVVRTIPGAAYAVAWSPDGKTLAISASGTAVQLWDAETEATKATATLPITATTIHWSPDGNTVVGHNNSGVSVFDVAENKVRFRLAGGTVPQANWARTGRAVLFGVGTKTLNVWELGQNKPLHTFEGHAAVINAAALTPSGKVLATASSDKTVKIWDVATGKELQTLQGHAGAVNALAWSANGKALASASSDKTVKLWDAPTGELTKTLEGHKESVSVLAWGSKALASGSLDQNVHIWNPQSGQLSRSIPMFMPVMSLAWTNDGQLLAGGGPMQTLFIWNASTGAVLKKLDRPGSPPSVAALAWPTSPAMIASGRGNHTIQIWDLQNDKVLHDLKALAPVHSVGWTFDSKTLVAGIQDRCVRSWDAASGLIRATVVAEEDRAALVSAEGHYRILPEGESDLVCVIQSNAGQDTYPIAELNSKFRFKNSPSLVKLTSE